MAVNSSFCLKDNRAVQNIRYMSQRQGLQDWFQRMKDSDTKLTQTLAAYHQRNPDQVSGGSKRGKTSTAQTLEYLEEIISSTKVHRQTEGEMMWEKEYIQFAQTLKAGRLTDDEAKAKWQEWSSQAANNDESVFTDLLGPVHHPLRIWVKTADKIVFENTFEKRKGVKFAKKPEKITSDNQVDGAARSVLLDHEKLGGESSLSSIVCCLVWKDL
eukprot:6487890-Amphidinium_carterae.1